jgi:CRP-like cAMP-binding protein
MKEVKEKNSKSTLELFLKQLAGKYSKFQPGQTILSEGDQGNTMLLILSGSVIVSKKNPKTGQNIVIATRDSGEFIGEMALVEQSPRFATVKADTVCEVLEISKLNFEKIIKDQPSFATQVLKSLSTKLRESDSRRTAELIENNRHLQTLSSKLLELNSFLDSVIDLSPSAMFLVARDGTILRTNRAADRLFNISPSEARIHIGHLFSNLKLSDINQIYGTSLNLEVTGIRGKEEFPVNMIVTALPGRNEEILHLAICQDLSQIHMFQAAAIDFDKLIFAQRTMAELFSSIKADFENLKETTDQLQASITGLKPAEVQAKLSDIIEKGSRLAAIIDRYLKYRPSEEDYTFVDLRTMFRSIIKFLEHQRPFKDVKITMEAASEFPWRLHLREAQFQSFLLALMIDTVERFGHYIP